MMDQPLPISLPVRISDKDGKPCLDLRRITYDENIMKIILTAAFQTQPILFLPEFKDKIKSVNSAMNKGLIALDETDGQYYLII